MKKIFIFMLFLIAVFNLTAQHLVSSEHSVNTDYLQKSRKQCRTGLILFGGGTALFAGGLVVMQHSNDKGASGIPFLLGGMAMGVSSIPFFTSSAINKHKAKLSVSKEALIINPGTKNNIYQASIALKINL